MNDAARLQVIRAAHAAITPGRWSRAADAEGEFLEAAGPMGELLPLARLDPGASEAEKHFLADAPDHVGFLLGLVDRAIARFASRAASPSGRAGGGPRSRPDHRGKDYAAEAAMRCAEPAFRVFLEARHGLERPLTDERVAQRVRSLCGVVSRRELNDGQQAAERWRRLLRMLGNGVVSLAGAHAVRTLGARLAGRGSTGATRLVRMMI